MSSLRIFKVLFFLGALNTWTIYPAITAAASDLTYEEAKSFLESVSKVKTQDKDVVLRWTKPLYVYLDLKDDQILTSYIKGQLLHLNREVHGLKVIITPVKNISNFTIELVKEYDFLAKVKLAGIAYEPKDACAAKYKGTDQGIEEVSILIKDTGQRQFELHCAARLIMANIGIGDTQKDGAILINSVLEPYDKDILTFSSLDMNIIKFAYSKTDSEREKYIIQFQKNSTFNSFIWRNKENIKSSLLYLAISNMDKINTKSHIDNIMKINDKTIAYSYLSYLPNLFLYDNFGLDFSLLDLNLLEEAKDFCRSCFFTLLRTKINKSSYAMDQYQFKSLSLKFIQTYDPKTDTPILKARFLFNNAVNNIKEKSSLESFREAESIFSNFYGDQSAATAWTRHALSKWYYFQGDYRSAVVEILKNHKLFNGTVFDPVSEGSQLIDGAVVFMGAGLPQQAQAYLNEAYLRLDSAKDVLQIANQELVRLANTKKQYNLN